MENAVTQEWLIDFLSTEGFRGKVDKDCYIHFKYEGEIYFLFLDDNDPDFLCINYFATIQNKYKLTKEDIHDILIDITSSVKIGKINIRNIDNNIISLIFSLEMFLNKELFLKYFARYLRIIKYMSNETAKRILSAD